MNCNTADVIASDFDFAAMKPCAYGQADTPGFLTDRQGASPGPSRAIKRRENAIACAFHQGPAMSADDMAGKIKISRQRWSPSREAR